MKRLFSLLYLFILLPAVISAGGPTNTDSLLRVLDVVIANRHIYLAQKEESIAEARQAVDQATDPHDRFNALINLYGNYHPFNTDSAYAVSLRLEALARQIGDSNLALSARLNKANILSSTGMYYETLVLMDSIRSDELPDYLRPYYYHTLRTVYGYLAEYSAFEPERERYAQLTDSYRDSLLLSNDAGSLIHVLIRADQLNVHNRPDEAIGLLEDYLGSHDVSEHDRAICA